MEDLVEDNTLTPEEIEAREDEASLLKDLVRSRGWKYLRRLFARNIRMARWKIGQDISMEETYKLRERIRVLERIMLDPERLAESFEEEVKEARILMEEMLGQEREE